jgi:calcium-dependent protein kinase
MGNFFCDCNRNTTNNIQQKHIVLNSLDPSSYKAKKVNTYPSSTINNTKPTSTSKEPTLNVFWNNTAQSPIISKSKGVPEDKYTITSTLHQSNTSTIYVLKHKQTNETRAMKTIIKQNKTFPIDKPMLHELDILTQIDHPNITKLYEVYDLDDKICFITDLYEATPLTSYKGSPEMSSELEIAIIMYQLLNAVNYCHNKTLMHRDITPENILVGNKHYKGHYHIKLINFYITKLYIHSNISTSVLCKAPEVIGGNYKYKSDLWSCGVVLYYLLTTKFPFYANETNDICHKITHCIYDKLENKQYNKISTEAKDLVYKLININYNERYSALNALEHVWFHKLKIKDKLYNLTLHQMQTLLNNISTFNIATHRYQIPIINYIIHFNYKTLTYVNYAMIMFNKIDINNEGSLNKNEFIHNVNLMFSEFDTEIDKQLLLDIFKKIDVNNNGTIRYVEFVATAVDKKELVKDEMLREVFDYFDKGKCGTIMVNEVIQAFNSVDGYDAKEVSDAIRKVVDGCGCGREEEGIHKGIEFNVFASIVKAVIS